MPDQKVLFKTNFFQDKSFALFLCCFGVVALLTGAAMWWWIELGIQNPPSNEVFPATVEGKLTAPIPLTQAGITQPALLEWVVEACSAAYNFNFVDYEQAILSASQYFTKSGYENYRKALLDSNVIEMVTTKQYVVSAVPTSAPLILREKPTPEGIYSWQIQMPMLISYQNSKELFRQNVVLTMLVTRIPVTDSDQTVGIAALLVRVGRE